MGGISLLQGHVIYNHVCENTFLQECLRAFTWFRFINTQTSQTYTFLSLYGPKHAGKTKSVETTGAARFKRDTLVEQNGSLKAQNMLKQMC